MSRIRKKADELVDLYKNEYADIRHTVIELMILLEYSKEKWFGLGRRFNRIEIEYIEKTLDKLIGEKYGQSAH